MSDSLAKPGSGEMFSRIATRYDLMNRLMTLGRDGSWRRKMVAFLPTGQGRHLDVATGTGDIVAAVRRRHPNKALWGLDPSDAMLEQARKKLGRLPEDSQHVDISWRVGSAEALPFDNGFFDSITIGFGVRNFADRRTGLLECARVLRPGGTLLILESSEPDKGVKAFFPSLYVRWMVPLWGRLVGRRREYKHLQSSMAAFPRPPRFCDELKAAGFEVETVTSFMLQTVHLFCCRRR